MKKSIITLILTLAVALAITAPVAAAPAGPTGGDAFAWMSSWLDALDGLYQTLIGGSQGGDEFTPMIIPNGAPEGEAGSGPAANNGAPEHGGDSELGILVVPIGGPTANSASPEPGGDGELGGLTVPIG